MQYKHLEGGMLYLLGEPHLFWSMMIHRKATKLCFPHPAESHIYASGEQDFDCWAGLELQRVLGECARTTTRTENKDTKLLKFSSRSMAASLIMNDIRRGIMQNEMLDDCKNLECLSYPLPTWWKDCESLWSGACEKAVLEGKPICMFYLTPTGCSQRGCVGLHCHDWAAEIGKIKLKS